MAQEGKVNETAIEVSDQQQKLPKTNTADVAAMIGRAGIGAIPVVGPAVAEVLTAVIPGQRLDRIQSFLEHLSERVKDVEQQLLEERMKAPEGVDLLEDCLIGASRALSEQRLKYLANLYATGMTSEQVDHETNKKMVTLLNQLSDAEVIWLMYLNEIQGINDYPDRNNDILEPRVAFMGSTDKEMDEATIQDAWKDTLVRLGLVEHKLTVDFQTKQPKLNFLEHDFEYNSNHTTWLGQMLVRYIVA